MIESVRFIKSSKVSQSEVLDDSLFLLVAVKSLDVDKQGRDTFPKHATEVFVRNACKSVTTGVAERESLSHVGSRIFLLKLPEHANHLAFLLGSQGLVTEAQALSQPLNVCKIVGVVRDQSPVSRLCLLLTPQCQKKLSSLFTDRLQIANMLLDRVQVVVGSLNVAHFFQERVMIQKHLAVLIVGLSGDVLE